MLVVIRDFRTMMVNLLKTISKTISGNYGTNIGKIDKQFRKNISQLSEIISEISLSRYVCFDSLKAVLCCAGLVVRFDYCTIGYLLEKRLKTFSGNYSFIGKNYEK